MNSDELGIHLLTWHERHGRTDLPWQLDPTPYRVWVSEIMLQQTQVATVIPYYNRFVESFPAVQALAAAPLDRVLHLWTGLGYYARARHLHRSAALICRDHGGEVPADIDVLRRLPGIGRSTAGAILALALGQRHPILDGNAKRVLARVHAVQGWPGLPKVERALWALAERHTPRQRVAQYTQAIMDLGATLCMRANPACGRCPLQAMCAAYARGEQTRFPAPRPRKPLPVRQTRLMVVRRPDGSILLEQRPAPGLWGGLWSLPECPPGEDPHAWCLAHLGCHITGIERREPFRHSFSHFHLDITPVHASVLRELPAAMEAGGRLWYNISKSPPLGLAAPVKRLLATLAEP